MSHPDVYNPESERDCLKAILAQVLKRIGVAEFRLDSFQTENGPRAVIQREQNTVVIRLETRHPMGS